MALLRHSSRLLFTTWLSLGSAYIEGPALAQTRAPIPVPPRAPTPAPETAPSIAARPRPGTIVSTLTFADLGFGNGGYDSLPDLAKCSDPRRWSRGLVVIGSLAEVSGYLDSPVATLAGPLTAFGTLAAVRISGLPALMVADITTAGRRAIG